MSSDLLVWLLCLCSLYYCVSALFTTVSLLSLLLCLCSLYYCVSTLFTTVSLLSLHSLYYCVSTLFTTVSLISLLLCLSSLYTLFTTVSLYYRRRARPLTRLQRFLLALRNSRPCTPTCRRYALFTTVSLLILLLCLASSKELKTLHSDLQKVYD